MKIFIAGSGKLAQAILASKLSFPDCEIAAWEQRPETNEKSIIVHAGSGRQLTECINYCERTGSTLIELSTGLETETMEPSFTLIVCPNTSVLLLKVLNLLKLSGYYFKDNKVSILESHQSSKTSVPGTAFSFADALHFPPEKIISVRNTDVQRNEIGIPEEFLDKHAYHRIVIEDGPDEVLIETKVLGHASYIKGVKKIIEAVLKNSFEKKRYAIFELIDLNML